MQILCILKLTFFATSTTVERSLKDIGKLADDIAAAPRSLKQRGLSAAARALVLYAAVKFLKAEERR